MATFSSLWYQIVVTLVYQGNSAIFDRRVKEELKCINQCFRFQSIQFLFTRWW